MGTRDDLHPDYDDSHLPPVGEGTVIEISTAAGFKPRIQQKHSRHPARQTTLQSRDLRALEMTAAGATYAQVGRILSITPSAARQLVERALARRALEIKVRDLPAAKALQADRLDQLWRRWWPAALGDPNTGTAPDPKAAATILAIHDRMVRLHGLEAPVQVDVEHHVVATDQEERERRERIVRDLGVMAQRFAEHAPIEGTWTEEGGE